MDEFQRLLYLERIRPIYRTKDVKLILGSIGSDKELLLEAIKAEIIESKQKCKIISFNFNEFEPNAFKESGENLVNEIESQISNTEPTYIFINEIQLIKNYNLVLNSLSIRDCASTFITSSYHEYDRFFKKGVEQLKVFPIASLTFPEYLEHNKLPVSNESLQAYIRTGGRKLFEIISNEQRMMIIRSVINSSLFNTLAVSVQIDAKIIHLIMYYLFSHCSENLCANSLVAYLKTQGVKISPNTIYANLDFLDRSCAIHRIPRYDIRKNKFLSFKDVFYPSDISYLQIVKNDNSAFTEKNYANTLIYQLLLASGYNISNGRYNRASVDFIAEKDGKTFYVQTCYDPDKLSECLNTYRLMSRLGNTDQKFLVTDLSFPKPKSNFVKINLLDFLTAYQNYI
jgi:predicted AAA+ superfamily ATPase